MPVRDNETMNDQSPPEPSPDDLPALDALAEADPADAPDIAEGVAAGLQRELDQTGSPDGAAAESPS
jgi:hypothetical protein